MVMNAIMQNGIGDFLSGVMLGGGTGVVGYIRNRARVARETEAKIQVALTELQKLVPALQDLGEKVQALSERMAKVEGKTGL